MTGDARREGELGAGKWTESARTREELEASLPEGRARELQLRPARGLGLWWLIGGAVLGLLGLILWRSLG